MYTTLLVVTLLATPPRGPELAPPQTPAVGVTPARLHHGPMQAHPAAPIRPAPPLPWERVIRRCGKPCLIWARHVLDIATSPKGFAWQIKRLAHTARRAWKTGRLRPQHARRLKVAITRLTRGLKHMTADGLLTHRERLKLLRGVIHTGALLHRATRVSSHRPLHRPVRHRPRTPVIPPPAPTRF